MSKHTPGQWSVEVMPSGRVTVTSGQFFVAGSNNTFGLDLSNARLIAAAPDLFEFARDYISAYQNGFDGDDHLMLLAESLVAKVAGETHG